MATDDDGGRPCELWIHASGPSPGMKAILACSTPSDRVVGVIAIPGRSTPELAPSGTCSLGPVAPAAAVAPLAPVDSVAPVVPVAPGDPVAPLAPFVPVSPAAPVIPVAPVDPVAP